MRKNVPIWLVAVIVGVITLLIHAENERQIEQEARRRAGMYIDAIEEQERRLNAK